MTARPLPFGVRHGRLRLDGDLDEFHHALNALAADTCQGGRCDPISPLKSMCRRHAERAERRRLRGGDGL